MRLRSAAPACESTTKCFFILEIRSLRKSVQFGVYRCELEPIRCEEYIGGIYDI